MKRLSRIGDFQGVYQTFLISGIVSAIYDYMCLIASCLGEAEHF